MAPVLKGSGCKAGRIWQSGQAGRTGRGCLLVLVFPRVTPEPLQQSQPA
jgi:hypothetical protein